MPYDMAQFLPGDRLRTRQYYWHEGIYVGPQSPTGASIVHNDIDAGQVILSHPEAFAVKGRPIQLAERTPEPKRAEVVARALSLIGTKFDLLEFNCQHFARLAQHGIARSPRLQLAAISVGVAAALGAGVLGVWAGVASQKKGS